MEDGAQQCPKRARLLDRRDQEEETVMAQADVKRARSAIMDIITPFDSELRLRLIRSIYDTLQQAGSGGSELRSSWHFPSLDFGTTSFSVPYIDTQAFTSTDIPGSSNQTELSELVEHFNSEPGFTANSNHICASILKHPLARFTPSIIPIFSTPGGLYAFKNNQMNYMAAFTFDLQ